MFPSVPALQYGTCITSYKVPIANAFKYLTSGSLVLEEGFGFGAGLGGVVLLAGGVFGVEVFLVG